LVSLLQYVASKGVSKVKKKQLIIPLTAFIFLLIITVSYSPKIQAAYVPIYGTVFEDLNGNGIYDAGDPGISGVTISLSGPVQDVTTTDSGGSYFFRSYLAAGAYTITETDPSGFYSTTPNEIHLNVETGIEYRVDFGDIPNLVDCDVPGYFSTIQAAVNSTCETINLTAALYVENITIDRTLTIQGQGPANTVVDGSSFDSVFIVEQNAVLTLSSITIQGGEASGPYGRGGGILNYGVLTLNNVTVKENKAYNGGGIANDEGSLVIKNSTIHHNSTTGNSGAGIISRVPLTMTNTTISDNWTTGEDRIAGGIGIYGSTATLINCTIANNSTTGYAGGIYAAALPFTNDPEPVIYVMNTIIADNSATISSSDCFGTLNSLGYNLIEDTDGCTIIGSTSSNVNGKDPNLGPLQDNDGETWTRSLGTGSPAIDTGTCPDTTVDQRGFLRPIDLPGIPNADDGCDIGAFEVQYLTSGLYWLMLLLD
jgi:hypothetical protein